MKRWLLAEALAFATAGQGLASDLPPPAVPAPPRAPAAYIPPVSPVYNWGGVYFGFNLGYGFGTSNWSDPLDPPDQGVSSPAPRSGSISRAMLLSTAPRRISRAPLSMAKHPTRFAVPGRSARPRISGFRPCAHGSVMLLIAYCSMARRAARLTYRLAHAPIRRRFGYGLQPAAMKHAANSSTVQGGGKRTLRGLARAMAVPKSWLPKIPGSCCFFALYRGPEKDCIGPSNEV